MLIDSNGAPMEYAVDSAQMDNVNINNGQWQQQQVNHQPKQRSQTQNRMAV